MLQFRFACRLARRPHSGVRDPGDLSLSVHEAAHAWTADRLGDPTARLLGRLTLNPLAHIDWIGTVLFPLIAMYSGLPLIGWAKPVPVNWAQPAVAAP